MTLVAPWSPPVHAVQAWRNRADSNPTALSKENLMSAETDGVGDTRGVAQSLRADILALVPNLYIIEAGSTTGTYSVNFQATPNCHITASATLTGNSEFVLANTQPGCKLRLIVGQDGTGGHSLSITIGVTTKVIDVPKGANQVFVVDVEIQEDRWSAFLVSGNPDYVLNAKGVSAGQLPWSLGSDNYGWGPPAYPVISVFGRTGAVVKAGGDYTAADVTNAADKSSGSTQTFAGGIAAATIASSGGVSGTTGTFSCAVSATEVVAPVVVNLQTGNYVLVLGDAGRVVEMNVAGANTLTIPPNSSVAFPIGTVIEVHQYGAGQCTLTPGAGVTIRSDGAKLKTAAQYATVGVRKRATDEWVASGDLA